MNHLAIFSVPRSGSSWLGEIFNSSPETSYRFQPNFAYSFPLTLQRDSSFEEIQQFHKELALTNDPFVCDKLSISSKAKDGFPKDKQKLLVWKETHFIFLAETLLKNSDTKVIGLLRSPLACIASWLKIPKEFHREWDVLEQWRTGELKNEGKESHYFGFEKWKEAALLFERLAEEYPERFYVVNYDDLLLDTLGTVTKLFRFADLTITDQTLQFIQNSRNSSDNDAYSVFKKKNDDLSWQGSLPGFVEDGIKNDEAFIMLNGKYNWV